MTDLEHPDNEALAVEYVLQLLEEDEREEFQNRLNEDPQLRNLLHRWEARFAPIADEVIEITPPLRVKAAILERIAPKSSQPPKTRRWLAGLFGLAAAAIIAFVAFSPMLRQPLDLTPEFQAELTSADGALILVAGVIPSTHDIVIDRIAGSAPEGRVLQLWLIAEGSDTPVPLGLLDTETITTRNVVADDFAPSVRAGMIAISDEPSGGSPTGAPTGELLATGTFVDL